MLVSYDFLYWRRQNAAARNYALLLYAAPEGPFHSPTSPSSRPCLPLCLLSTRIQVASEGNLVLLLCFYLTFAVLAVIALLCFCCLLFAVLLLLLFAICYLLFASRLLPSVILLSIGLAFFRANPASLLPFISFLCLYSAAPSTVGRTGQTHLTYLTSAPCPPALAARSPLFSSLLGSVFHGTPPPSCTHFDHTVQAVRVRRVIYIVRSTTETVALRHAALAQPSDGTFSGPTTDDGGLLSFGLDPCRKERPSEFSKEDEGKKKREKRKEKKKASHGEIGEGQAPPPPWTLRLISSRPKHYKLTTARTCNRGGKRFRKQKPPPRTLKQQGLWQVVLLPHDELASSPSPPTSLSFPS